MTLAVVCVFVLLMGAVILLTARRMTANAFVSAEAPDFADVAFDPARYRAMQRLLSENDWSFVESAVRSSKGLRQARAERKRLFTRYLKNLETDFYRLHASARALIVDAPEDRPELAQALMSQHFAFKRAMFETRMRLYVPALGDAAQGVGRMLDVAESMMATGRQAIAGQVAAA